MPNVCGAVNEYSRALVANWVEDRRGALPAPNARFAGVSEAAAAHAAPPPCSCGRAPPVPTLSALPGHLLLPHGPAIVPAPARGAAAPAPEGSPRKKGSSARVRKLKQDAIARTPKVGEEATDGARRAVRLERLERHAVGGGGRVAAAAAEVAGSGAPPPTNHGRSSEFSKSLKRSILTG